MPDGHVLVEVDFPRGKEDGTNVVIPCLYHLANFLKLINVGLGVYVLVYGPCIVPYHEVVRIVQLRFQPQAAATPFLDSGRPCAFFKPDGKVCMQMTRYDTIHRLIYNRYE